MRREKEFLLVCQRWDLDVREDLYFEDDWEKTASLQDLVKSQTWHLKMHGCQPDPQKIANVLKKFVDKNGLITDKTNVRLELLVCVF